MRATLTPMFLCLAVISSPLLHAGDGEVQLGSGLKARFSYHFDRNALVASRDVGDALIAVTRSGNLLRLDRASFKITHECVGPAAALCLGVGDGDAVLAGFEDGRVCRVDPATLELTDIAKLPGRIQWVAARMTGKGGRPGLVVVVEKSTPGTQKTYQWETITSVVHDFATGRTIDVPRMQHANRGTGIRRGFEHGRRATTFLLDSKSRLWLGAELDQ
jgi:hypothetical protein